MPMNWTSLAKFYGFHRPFNFKVAIPFLLGVFALVAVFIVCTVLFFGTNLSIGTERFHFFSYIGVLLLIAAILSRVTTLSYAVLVWCTVELALAILSTAFEEHGVGTPLFPKDTFTQSSNSSLVSGFIYHPLLQGVPSPNLQRRVNIEMPSRDASKVVNWRELVGHEVVFSHNSFGLRGIEPGTNDLKRDLIFVYGGSSTYDIAVTQGSTWVERLQTETANRYTFFNFGVPGYSTTENLIQTAFYQNVVIDKRPVCSIYYVGWNDIHNAHIENLDWAYADWHLPNQVAVLGVRKPEIWAAKYSPLARLFYERAKQRFDSLPQASTIHRGNPVGGSEEHLEKIFAEHVSAIAAINTSRGIKTVFIGQLLNREKWTEEEAGGWFPLVRHKDVWPLQARFNHILETTSILSGAKYIDAGIDNFSNSDFVDRGHFSAAGSRKFAQLVAKKVEVFCR